MLRLWFKRWNSILPLRQLIQRWASSTFLSSKRNISRRRRISRKPLRRKLAFLSNDTQTTTKKKFNDVWRSFVVVILDLWAVGAVEEERNCRKNDRLFVKLIGLTCVGCSTVAWDLAFLVFSLTWELKNEIQRWKLKHGKQERNKKKLCVRRIEGERDQEKVK